MSAAPHDPFGAQSGARTTQRRGRMSPARRAALVELADAWVLDPADTVGPGGPASAAGHAGPVLIDIGAGTGTATTPWARDHPDHLVVAVELHRPGIAVLLQALDDGGPSNVRVIEADITLLAGRWPAGSVDGIRVLFPDPWPKRRHRHRRLVDEGFVATITDALRPGGRLHVATDWPEYAEQVAAALSSDERLVPSRPAPIDPAISEDPDVQRWATDRPERPVTPYEARGIDAGRPITDLVAVRRS